MDEKKNKGGHPPIIETPEEMESLIDAYFKRCEPTLLEDENGVPRIDKRGNVIWIQKEKPTVTGLALALGFASKQSIYDYRDNKKRPEFSYPITRALLRIENSYEQKLYENQNRADFALKNMGWSDKHELEHSGELGVTIVDDIKGGKNE